jgi:hypothetical protein
MDRFFIKASLAVSENIPKKEEICRNIDLGW